MKKKNGHDTIPATDIGDGTTSEPGRRKRRTKEQLAAARDPLLQFTAGRDALKEELERINERREAILLALGPQ